MNDLFPLEPLRPASATLALKIQHGVLQEYHVFCQPENDDGRVAVHGNIINIATERYKLVALMALLSYPVFGAALLKRIPKHVLVFYTEQGAEQRRIAQLRYLRLTIQKSVLLLEPLARLPRLAAEINALFLGYWAPDIPLLLRSVQVKYHEMAHLTAQRGDELFSVLGFFIPFHKNHYQILEPSPSIDWQRLYLDCRNARVPVDGGQSVTQSAYADTPQNGAQ